MRTVKYLSPSAIGLWLEDRQEYYLKYLTDHRPPKMEQTPPMSVGSAFDAELKSFLFKRIFGFVDPQFEFETIFVKQVDAHNRDFARAAGADCMKQFRDSGALADLLLELQLAKGDPRFEFLVRGDVRGIPIQGFPDLYFILEDGTHCIYDFKVNGYCSKSNTSPKPGYILCRDGNEQGSRSHMKAHKDAIILKTSGIKCNHGIHDLDDLWERQLMIYGWLEGVAVGENMIGGIEQLACGPKGIRIASHRKTITAERQERCFKLIHLVWESITSDDEAVRPHVFTDMTKADSDAECDRLDEYHRAFNTPKGKLYGKMAGR